MVDERLIIPVHNVNLDWSQEILAIQRKVYSLPWLQELRMPDHAEAWISAKRRPNVLSKEYERLLADHAPYCNVVRWLEIQEKDSIYPFPAQVFSFDYLSRGCVSMAVSKVSSLWSHTYITPDVMVASTEMLDAFGVKYAGEYPEADKRSYRSTDYQQYVLLLGVLERLQVSIPEYLQGLYRRLQPKSTVMICTLNGAFSASYEFKLTFDSEATVASDGFQITYAMNHAEAEAAITEAGFEIKKFAYGSNIDAAVQGQQIPAYLNYHVVRN